MRYRRGLLLLITALAAPAAEAERVADPAKASVYIRVIGNVRVRVSDSWTETLEERNVEIGTGSGFVFTPYGHVLTNHHVVEGGSTTKRIGDREAEIQLTVDRIEVMLPGAEGEEPALRLPATLENSSPELDLAVLSVSGPELPYLGLGDSDAAEPGEDAIVYGFPFGREVEVGKTAIPDILPKVSVSRGAVAAVRADDRGSTAFLQTTATVNPGNSGGPMVDGEGFVLGVIRLKLRDADGIGFAVPVNSVKDFLELNGYSGLLPAERLRLGPEETLEGKGITLRLPQTIEDVSPSRIRAFSDPAEPSIQFASDRVATPWDLSRLEQALVSGEAFASFQANGSRKAALHAGGRVLAGSASGVDPASAREMKLEYALFENGMEKVVVRYLGRSEAVAYNRSVLRESLGSVRVTSLLTAPVEAPIDPEAMAWQTRKLAAPSAPEIPFPSGWEEELSSPFPCPGLAPPDSALSASMPGDFRVSLRAGYWSRGWNAVEASRACSARAGRYGEASYRYGTEFLGTSWAIEGAFVPSGGGGLLQLEVVAPVETAGFVTELARDWLGPRTPRPE